MNDQIRHIPLRDINARHNIREVEDVSELTRSIEQHGLIQPIVVRPVGSGYELVAGHRRYRAVSLLGESTIAAVVHEQILDRDVGVIRLMENVQRLDMRPSEIVDAIEAMKASNRMMTDTAVAHSLGKTQTWLMQVRKAARAEARLLEEGMSPDQVQQLTRADLQEVSYHDDKSEVAHALLNAPAKAKALEKARKDRGARKIASYKDSTGGLSVLSNGTRVVVMCRDSSIKDRLMKEILRLKAEWA